MTREARTRSLQQQNQKAIESCSTQNTLHNTANTSLEKAYTQNVFFGDDDDHFGDNDNHFGDNDNNSGNDDNHFGNNIGYNRHSQDQNKHQDQSNDQDQSDNDRDLIQYGNAYDSSTDSDDSHAIQPATGDIRLINFFIDQLLGLHGCTEENHLEALGGNDYANITLGSLGQQTIDCLGPNRQVLNSDIILNSSDNIRKLGSNKCKFLFERSSIDGQLALN